MRAVAEDVSTHDRQQRLVVLGVRLEHHRLQSLGEDRDAEEERAEDAAHRDERLGRVLRLGLA